MAPIAELIARSTDMAASAVATVAPVYSSSVLLATFSFLTVLLIILPMCWHYRNRNLGATLLVAWTIIMNVQTFLNAVLWPADNISTWYNGAGLCDVEVKLQVAWGVAAPATLGCVLRALANVMNTDRATLIKSKAQRWRDYSIDLSWCIGFPLLQMLFHYIVQDRRYYLYGISGCVPSVSASWLTILLIYIPPVIWTLIDGYFASECHNCFSTILTHADHNSTHHRSTLPLPPQLRIHPSQQQHNKVPLYAFVRVVHGVDSRLHPNASLCPLHQLVHAQDRLQLVRDAQSRRVERDHHGSKPGHGPV